MIFWGLSCGFALLRLLPLVVELRPKGLVVATGLATRSALQPPKAASVWPTAPLSHRLLPSVVELRPKGLVVARRAAPAFWT